MSHGFFNMIDRLQFVELLRAFAPLPAESISLFQADGRVLAEELVATHDWPLTNRSCMDGYAVNARDVFGASETNPGYLECVAELRVDEQPGVVINPGECARINTGGTLPEGTDAVIMVEHTEEMGDGTIEIRKAAAPWLNVMRQGEDATQGKAILESGTALRCQEVGLAAALGFETIAAHQCPKVGILSTGDELIEVSDTPRPGQVRDVNSATLSAICARFGAIPKTYGIIRDDLPSLTEALKQAVAENDIVLLSGGSSIGIRDLTVEAVDALGDSEILAHGVAISPGKPTILARCGQKPVIGLPGQVASAQVVMTILIGPLLRHMQGDKRAFEDNARPARHAIMARNVASKQGREDYVRVRLEERDGELPLAHPVLGKSGLLRTLTSADGLAVIPGDAEGIYKDAMIKIITL